MLKYIFLFLFLIISLYSETLELKNITFTTENDADFRTDSDYSFGSELSFLFYIKDLNNSFFHIPFTDYKNQDNYISFSYAQKIYTPADIELTELNYNDRPYAGYMYLKSGLYQSANKNLKSLVIQIGFIGPSTKMDALQSVIHTAIGAHYPEGWNNQLKNELIIQVNYSHKKYLQLTKESVFIPEYGFELGNSSTKGYIAGAYRWGNSLPQDYGSSQVDNVNYHKIPLSPNIKYKQKLRYSFNLSFKANLIAKDIFLDGNTLQESHSVDKNVFVAEVGYGISIDYGKFSLDYLRKHFSPQFKTQDRYPSYGSLIFSYNF